MAVCTVGALAAVMEELAPAALALEYDNVGLIIGRPDAPVGVACVALDATLPVIEWALSHGAQALVTHHPLLFAPMRTLRFDEPIGRCVQACVMGGLNVLSAHTNLDAAPDGVAHCLARVMGAPQAELRDCMAVGALSQPVCARELCVRAEDELSGPMRPYLVGAPETLVARAAFWPGQAEEDTAARALALGAQALVVGEIKHHQLIAAMGLGLPVIVAGHMATETPALEVFANGLQTRLNALQYEIRVYSTQRCLT